VLTSPHDFFELNGFAHADIFDGIDHVWQALDRLSSYLDSLGDRGWLLVRPSGTEPIIRVTAECTDENLARTVVETTASALRECLSDRRIPSADIAS